MTGILGGLIGSLKKLLVWASSQSATLSRDTYTAGSYADLANGKYFLFSKGSTDADVSANTLYRYSTDGLTWENGNLPASSKIFASAASPTTLIVFTATDVAYTTTNGTTWTTRDTGTSDRCHEAIWNGTYFVAAFVSTSATIRYSTDGATWTNYPLATGASGIATNGSFYMITPATTTSTYYYLASSNITNSSWSSGTLPAASNWYRPIFGNGIWLAFIVASASYATSTNGISWTSRTLPATFGRGLTLGVDANRALFVNGKFYINTNNEVLYESEDGVNWSIALNHSATTNLDCIGAWAVGPTRIVGAGYADLTTISGGSDFQLTGE